MRLPIAHLDSNSLPWQGKEGSPIASKELNRDPDTGASTTLLKSAPRPPGAFTAGRPHFHDADEEFFCLQGPFVFDTGYPVDRFGYAFYPEGRVHGFNVSVPDGYLLYLRMSSGGGLTFVDAPEHDAPYTVDGKTTPRPMTVTENTTRGSWADVGPGVRALLLSADPTTGEGATLVELTDGGSVFGSGLEEGYIELFVIDGESSSDTALFKTGSYAFHPPGTEVPKLTAPGECRVLINHGQVLSLAG